MFSLYFLSFCKNFPLRIILHLKSGVTMKKLKTALGGISLGVINALFGAGGGMIAVPLLKSKGKTQKEAQASALGVILPLCVLSAVIYYIRGYYTLSEALPYVPFSVAGALAGTFAMKKIPDRILRKIFALFMLYLGVRMIMK